MYNVHKYNRMKKIDYGGLLIPEELNKTLKTGLCDVVWYICPNSTKDNMDVYNLS